MTQVLIGLSFLSLMMALIPHYSKDAFGAQALSLSFLHAAEVFVFYFLCRIVSVDGRNQTSSKFLWIVFEKLVVPLAIIFSVYKAVEFSLISAASFFLAMIILYDPQDQIGAYIRNSASAQLLKGIAPEKRDSIFDYLPAFVILGIFYWLLIN